MFSLRTRRARVLTLSLGAFGVLVAFLAHARNKPEPRLGQKIDAASAVAAPNVPTVARPSHPFQYDSTLSVQGNQMETNLGGRLVSSSTWQEQSLVWRSYQVDSPRVTIRGGSQVRTEAPGIEQPFAVGYRPGSEEAQVAFSPRISQQARQLIVGLAGALSLRVTPGDQKTWTTAETDASGAYEATYTRDGKHAIVKTKTAYLSESAQFQVKHSSARAVLDDSGELSELSFNEALTEDSLNMTYVTSLRLQPVHGKAGLWASANGRIPAGFERQAIHLASALNAEDAARAMPQLELSKALTRMKDSGDVSMKPEDFLAVTARLKTHPEDLVELERILRQQPELASQLGALLVATGGNESRRLVEKLFVDESIALQARLEIMQNLLFRGSVDEGLLRAVEKATESTEPKIATAALQLLPEVIARGRAQGTLAVEKREKEYLAAASQCRTDQECAAYATGLGYLQTEDALLEVRKLLSHDDSFVRAAALSTLEVSPHSIGEPWIVERIKTEPEDRVRARAIRACSLRGGPVCAAGLGLALRSGSPRDKFTAMDALARGRFRPEVARKQLNAALAVEADSQMKQRIAGLVDEIDAQ